VLTAHVKEKILDYRLKVKLFIFLCVLKLLEVVWPTIWILCSVWLQNTKQYDWVSYMSVWILMV